MKRAYKLQEFVAHASNVNCLKIGKKSSRVLVTGGEDHKVNMWAIGKPNAIMTLSGHTSAVESVTYDSAEVLVVAGSASGTIKLWDLEEARIVRTLTGHRSNCVSLDFHPFGEFFASGSLDTNLKIWDIRRKDCIHTYKGHTHGVNAIKFSPDGRWVVSGGEDNVVKLWDLTAGKLMHDFRFHEGQIHCIDFHPHEYLLATGSADRTVKLWDLETFELIGSAGPETTGIRSMIFNPDGRTLLCGMHESLKVFSWEPIIMHDTVEVGWSRLGDLSIHEGKLLGCSYNQSCVGVWVVDISRVGPYGTTNASRTKTLTEGKLGSSSHQLVNNLKNSVARLSMSHNTESGVKDPKNTASVTAAESHSPTQRTGMAFATKNLPANSGPSYVMTPKKNNVSRVQPVPTFQSLGRADVAPVIVPRNSARLETITDSKKEMNNVGRMVPSMGSSKSNDIVKSGNSRDESDKIDTVNPSLSLHQKQTVGNEKSEKNFARTDQNFISRFDTAGTNSTHFGEANPVGPGLTGAAKFRRNPSAESSDNLHDRTSMHARLAPDDRSISHPEHKTTGVDLSKRVVEPGRTRALTASWERRERGLATETAVPFSASTPSGGLDISSFMPRGSHGPSEQDLLDAGENDAIEDLMQQHNTFISILQTRLTKLQVIRRFWHRNDLKGAIEAMGKMGDHSVLTDVISVLMERSNVLTLDICTVLLPLLTRMLDSEIERHVTVSLETLLMLVKTFGHVIRATIVSSPTIGVDLQAEQRRERCNVCFVELEKVKQILVPLTRRHGTIAKYAQELSIALQEV